MPQPTTLRSQLVRHAAALAFASIGIAAAPAAHASTISFLTSGNYDTAANWQGGVLPGLNDIAVINGLTATKNGGTLSAAKVTLDGHSTLRFSGNSTVNTNVNFASSYDYLQLDGSGAGTTLTIAQGASLTGNLYHVGDDYAGGGKVSIINNGTMNKNDANPTQPANLTNVTNNGTINGLNGSTLNFLGSSTNNGALNITNSILTVPLLTGTGTTNMNNSTFNGNTEVASGQTVKVTNGLTVSGGQVLTIDKGAVLSADSLKLDGHSILRFSGDNTITTNVTFAGDYDYLQLDGSGAAGTTLTIAQGASLTGNLYHVGDDYAGGGKVSIINNGTMNKNDANPTQPANLTNVTNNGTINGLNGSTLNFLGSSTNNGALNITNSILTVPLLTGTGTTNMNNSTFNGNTEVASGQTVKVTNGLTVSGGQVLTIDKGAVLSADSLKLDGHSILRFSGDNTITTNVTFAGDYDYLQLDGSGAAGTTLTIAQGASLTGNLYHVGDDYAGGGKVSIINNGTMNKNDANPTQPANLTNVTNNGTINGLNGSTLNFLGSSTNNGALNITNSILTAPLLTGTGTTNMNNSTFNGNTEVASGQTVKVTNGLTVSGGQVLTIDKGAVLSADSLKLDGHSILRFSGDNTITTNVTFAGDYDYLQLDGSGAAGTTLTIAQGASLTGNLYHVGDDYAGGGKVSIINNGTMNKNDANPTQPANLTNVTNNGTIQASNTGTINFVGTQLTTTGNLIADKGSIIDVSGTGIAQSAGKTTVNGTLNLGGQTMALTGGILSGTGTITGAVNNTGGIVSLADGKGNLSVNGNYTQTATGKFLAALGGTVAGVDFNQLFVSGTASLSGDLQISLLNGYTPVVGQTFDFIKAGTLSGNFGNITSVTPGYTFAYNGAGGTGTLRVTGAAVTVPESGTGLLALLAGGASLGFVAFRKRKAA